MEIEKRIEVAKLFIAKLAEICGGDRGLKLTAPAKVWQGGNKVRVYGLARQGYVEILEDGTVRNEIDRPFPEIFEAIDAVAAELAAPVAEESTEYDELVEWAIGEVRKVVDRFAPETVIDDRTKIFDLLPAGEERDDYEEELAQVMCRIYRKAADEEYLRRTSKSAEELHKYDSYGSDWDCNCYGTEWENIWFCIACGEEAADAVLEEEREAEED